ncbi:MAG: hypothetical protein CMM77_09895 [Rhodospirillaceae bacterium]|nr:hypothetical protein [Rhodospirillaceae bacterium]
MTRMRRLSSAPTRAARMRTYSLSTASALSAGTALVGAIQNRTRVEVAAVRIVSVRAASRCAPRRSSICTSEAARCITCSRRALAMSSRRSDVNTTKLTTWATVIATRRDAISCPARDRGQGSL